MGENLALFTLQNVIAIHFTVKSLWCVEQYFSLISWVTRTTNLNLKTKNQLQVMFMISRFILKSMNLSASELSHFRGNHDMLGP